MCFHGLIDWGRGMRVVVLRSEVRRVRVRKVAGKDAVNIRVVANGFLEVELSLSKARKLYRQLGRIMEVYGG